MCGLGVQGLKGLAQRLSLGHVDPRPAGGFSKAPTLNLNPVTLKPVKPRYTLNP